MFNTRLGLNSSVACWFPCLSPTLSEVLICAGSVEIYRERESTLERVWLVT